VIGLTPGANVRQAGADYTHVADGRVREALEFLAAHLAERIDLRRLARHVGLSPAHLSRLFKAEAGDRRTPPRDECACGWREISSPPRPCKLRR
jgi:transcriptional regulator GlxA family with amidase domain